MLSKFLKRKEKVAEKDFKNVPDQYDYQFNTINENIKQISDSLSSITRAIRNLEARTQDITEKLEGISERVDTHDQEISNIKDAVEKMFALYDLVMKQYNPFLEEENIENIQDTQKNNDNGGDSNVEESMKKEYEKYLPLDEIKEDPAFIAIVMGWLNFLVSKGSVEEAAKAIEYYEEIGWITENVKIKLEKYLEGYYNIPTQGLKLTPEDHLISLYIIAKLKAGIEEGIVRFKDLYEELINRGMIKPLRK